MQTRLGAVVALSLLAGSRGQSPNSLPAGEVTGRLAISPTLGECFTNGTTVFRANAPVAWLLVPFDGDAPYAVVAQTPTQLTVAAGHRGGRLLVVAAALNCTDSACAEQATSPACSGVATGELTLSQLGSGDCSQAFANASWTIVPWWKVAGVTAMLTSVGVLFVLVVLARLSIKSVEPGREGPGSLFGDGRAPSARLQLHVGPTPPIYATRPTVAGHT
jgi:hypothetical protein